MNNNKRKLSHSQNFLKDSKLVAELVSGSSITNSDVVLKLGRVKVLLRSSYLKELVKLLRLSMIKI